MQGHHMTAPIASGGCPGFRTSEYIEIVHWSAGIRHDGSVVEKSRKQQFGHPRALPGQNTRLSERALRGFAAEIDISRYLSADAE